MNESAVQRVGMDSWLIDWDKGRHGDAVVTLDVDGAINRVKNGERDEAAIMAAMDELHWLFEAVEECRRVASVANGVM